MNEFSSDACLSEFYDNTKFFSNFFLIIVFAKERPTVKLYAYGYEGGDFSPPFFVFSDIESSKTSQRTSLKLALSDGYG